MATSNHKDVNIYDIARILNVSTATVSRALKNNPAVNKATRKKIVATARKMGYRPNNFASSLRSQKTNTIGVIISAVLLTLLPEGLRMLSGIEHIPGFTAERPLGWIGNTRMIIYSLLLIVLMLTRPQGLFSLKKSSVPK